MRISVLLSAAAIGLFLHGCASQPETTQQAVSAEFVPSENCRSNGVIEDSCVVELRVINKGMNDCEITLVDPNANLITAGKGMQGKFTFWKIVDSGSYVFTEDDGVTFVDNFRPRGFANGRRIEQGKVYRWRNLYRGPKVYSYVINVTNETDRECFLDPWYRN